ncbi:MAG: hypothetical protein GXO21_04390, partial [Aquificae bacterium]|nr:hypothetical protein [Aquificota bacterium]
MRFSIAIVLIFFILGFSYSIEKNNIEKCYAFFEKEKYLRSYECFKAEKDNIFYPYALYFALLQADTLGLKTTEIEKDLSLYEDIAITHYSYLFLTRKYLDKDLKKASYYLSKIDDKALKKEDIPIYLFLKSKILEAKGLLNEALKIEKKLATEYPYDRFYGYKTLREIAPYL